MRSAFLLVLIPLMGCSLPAPEPPAAEFLVADGSTTYWVKSSRHGISARTSPLILTHADNKFYELYVGEVTRSYEDAIFIREPIYRRDVLSGDSTILFEDARISDWEKSYLQRNPDARLLEPEEDSFEDVGIAATGESEILAVAGPYVLFEQWATLERDDFQQADSARSAIDIRSGRSIPISALARDTALLGAGAESDGKDLRWRHSGYDVIARWDEERSETAIILRNRRGREWPLGYVDTRLPRIFWLDDPKVDTNLRKALVTAFEGARADDVDTYLVNRGGSSTAGPSVFAVNR
jgi:hypothetical protein